MKRKDIFYGWVIVVFAALTCFFSGPGQNFSLSVFMDEYVREFGMSYSEVSFLFGLGTIVAGSFVTTMGAYVDAWGHRRASLYAGLLFATVCFFNSMISGQFSLLLSLIFIRFCAQDAFVLIAKTIINQWFQTKRGRAHAFMGLGFVGSQALVPLINASIITAYDWRFCWKFWASMLAAVFVPFSQILVVDKPAQVRLKRLVGKREFDV